MKRSLALGLAVMLGGCASAEPPAERGAPPVAVADAGPAPRDDGPRDPRLDAFAQELRMELGEKRAIAATYVRSARARIQELRYEEAATDLERATCLDPENEDVRRLLDRVHVADPHGPTDYRGQIEALAEEHEAKEQQDRVFVKRLFTEGEILLEKQCYDEAIRRFERVLEAIRWSPASDPGSFEAQARDALVAARVLVAR